MNIDEVIKRIESNSEISEPIQKALLEHKKSYKQPIRAKNLIGTIKKSVPNTPIINALLEKLSVYATISNTSFNTIERLLTDKIKLQLTVEKQDQEIRRLKDVDGLRTAVKILGGDTKNVVDYCENEYIRVDN